MQSNSEMDFPQLRECERLCQTLQSLDKQKRKQAIINFKRVLETGDRLSPEEYHEIFRSCHIYVLNALRDPSEAVREHTIILMNKFILEFLPSNDYYLSYVFPILVERLGTAEIVEESEELRLQLVRFMNAVLESYNEHQLKPFINDYIAILKETVQDKFPEIKLESFKCIVALAHCLPLYFHKEATQLVKPVLSAFSHQRFKVRMEAVKCIGEIVLYSEANTLEMSVGAMAQRLFDSVSVVRQSVIETTATWMTNYRDRYSFFHRLLPIILTGLNDEVDDTRIFTENLWCKIGIQYAQENEKDLKDQMDFLTQSPKYYPPSLNRPNLGCRVLVQRHLGKLATAISNELTSWQRDVRIRCGQLLYSIVVHAEDAIIQQMPVLLHAMFNAVRDSQRKNMQILILDSVKFMALFVPVDNWMKLVVPTIEDGHFGNLAILAAFIHGTPHEFMVPNLLEVCEVFSRPEVTYNHNFCYQMELVNCVQAVEGHLTPDSPDEINQHLFNVIVTVISLREPISSSPLGHHLLEEMKLTLDFVDHYELWHRYARNLLIQISENPLSWGEKTIERLIFNTILCQSGLAFGECSDIIGKILLSALHKNVPIEARWKTLSALAEAMDNKVVTMQNIVEREKFLSLLINDIVSPTLVWSAGRVSEIMRQLGAKCLINALAPLEGPIFETPESLRTTYNNMHGLLLSLTEDTNEKSRQQGLECLVLFKHQLVKNNIWEIQDLVKIYPEFLKRLDDPDEDVRCYTVRALRIVLLDIPKAFCEPTYRGHHEVIIDTLMTHFDDDDEDFRRIVHSILNLLANVNAYLLKDKVEKHRPIIRNQIGCDEILMYLNSLHIH